ncbi:hypothetical protein RFI_06311 [Reticulomyxa filosa]|uniref:Uncharacterized protein n=1 Tax=Reticulomyxa filosa TaxID=46433 RepID=X6NZT4_RETFI|nr:hypothetical protein RFI_06311 [Reticulomyxa filosa]|eukprot:ETO30812.1 hypothetical protein RFI_06311 [Reticulomyxa filosa]
MPNVMSIFEHFSIRSNYKSYLYFLLLSLILVDELKNEFCKRNFENDSLNMLIFLNIKIFVKIFIQKNIDKEMLYLLAYLVYIIGLFISREKLILYFKAIQHIFSLIVSIFNIFVIFCNE